MTAMHSATMTRKIAVAIASPMVHSLRLYDREGNDPARLPSRLPFLPSLRLYPAEPQQEGMGSIPLLVEAVGAASRGVACVLDQRLGDEALTALLDLAEQISMQGMRGWERPPRVTLLLFDLSDGPVRVDRDAVGVDGLKLDA